MRILVLVCLAAVLAETFAFGYSNYQLPQFTTKREALYSTRVAGGFRSRQCANKDQCTALNTVGPLWLFRNAKPDTLAPLNRMVLIAYEEDDEGTALSEPTTTSTRADGGVDDSAQATTTQASLYTGIVVAAARDLTASSAALLTEGQRVYFSTRCVARWTVASWTALYGSEKAAFMNNKLINGVDLNNAEGLAFFSGAVENSFPLVGRDPASNGFGQAAATSYYPGAAGSPPTDANGLAQNPNQQANYLLCLETDILGVVQERSWPDLDSHHYSKSTTLFRGQHLPYVYTP